MSRLRLLAPAAALVLLASACGGMTTYSPQPTRACLEKEERARVLDDVEGRDIVASTADGGAFSVRFPTNHVTLSFAKDRDEAGRLVRGYERTKGETIGLEDVLRVEHNAVMLWAAHPDELDLETIRECLE